VPRIKKISEFKPLITNLAQTSHYQVMFGGLNGQLSTHLNSRGVDTRFITESSGLLCSSDTLFLRFDFNNLLFDCSVRFFDLNIKIWKITMNSIINWGTIWNC